jgi:hypothetical protein
MITLALFGVLLCDVQSEMRTWTSRDGKFTIEARVTDFTVDGLRLTKVDGQTITVPMDKLSDDDRTYAVKVYKEQVANGPTLGFKFATLDQLLKHLKEAGITTPKIRSGLFVVEVTQGGPAEAAGIKELDIITHFNGEPVGDQRRITELLMMTTIGAEYEIKLKRPTEDNNGFSWSTIVLRIKTIGTAELSEVQRAEEENLAKLCPLQIVAATLGKGILDTPEITVKVKNRRKVAVLAYKVHAECYNRFGEKVGFIGDNVFRGISQTTIGAGDTETSTWAMHLHDNTTKVIIRVVQVKLDDGTEWRDADNKEATTVER